MSPLARTILTAGLLALGVQMWLLFDATLHAWMAYIFGGALLLAGVAQFGSRSLFRWLQRVRHVSPRTRAVTTLAVFVVAAAYLTFTAFGQERALYPKYHDNQSYAVQAQIIASGRLWLPAHAHPDFFDTFHVIGQPVYASMYFPGAAMLFAVGVLLHLPWWVVPILVAAGCVALLYRVTAELIDGLAGLLAALWLVSLIWFRHLSAMLMSHTVLLLVGLAIIWAYLRWRRGKQLRWALLIGAFAGFGAITRPADALCYALPIGFGILLDLRDRWAPDLFKTGAAIVAAAAPFLALQLVFNYGVSGHLLTSPYRVYLDRDAPQLSFGFHRHDPTMRAKSKIIQKQVYHLEYNARLIKQHRPEKLFDTWFEPTTGRLATLFRSTTPSAVLLPLVAAGMLGLGGASRRWVVAAVLPLYALLYLFYAALLQHYTPVVAPATIVLGLLGVRQAELLWPAAREGVAVFCTALIVGACVVGLPELNRMQHDDPFDYPEMTAARELIPSDPRVTQPALVFVRFTFLPGQNIHAEPVYNWEAARIDDNPIIYAHDLGMRNIELLRYYAKRQPERQVYYYDRLTGNVVSAGTVAEEFKRVAALPPA